MCISESSLAKLVIRYDEVDQYDMERVKREGELVTTYTRDHPECEGVEQDVWEYRYYFLNEEGEEEESTATVYSVADIIWDTEEIINVEEQWIKAIIYIRPYLNCFEHDDQFLLDALKKDHLRPPSTEPYNLTNTKIKGGVLDGQYGQPIFLDTVIFKRQVKNGFFIEAGADDFERDSNSLLFEMQHGWSGLLVEPNPTIYPKGFLKQRKAWAAPNCLATMARPHIVQFTGRLFEGGMAAISPEKREDTYDMQCFPLYSLLLAAAGNITVNYLSLDIEGAEFLVLQTIPWDKVDIEVLTVETNHAGEVFPGSKEEIRNYLADQGYVYVYTVEIDDVFVRKDLYEGKYAPDMQAWKKFDDIMKLPRQPSEEEEKTRNEETKMISEKEEL